MSSRKETSLMPPPGHRDGREIAMRYPEWTRTSRRAAQIDLNSFVSSFASRLWSRRRSPPSGPFAFMHVPKCAGYAFASALVRATGPSAVVHGFDRTLFGTFTDFDSVDEQVRQRIYLHVLPHRGTFDLIVGHFSLASLLAIDPDMRCLTVVREPRCRLVSHFLFWRGRPDPDVTKWGAYADRMRLARGRLETFLTATILAPQIDNLFTRFLLSPHPDIPDEAFIRAEMHDRLYREALVRLERVDLAVLLEDARLERRVSRFLGRRFQLERENVSTPRMDQPLSLDRELTAEALTQLDSLTAIDRPLWSHLARRSVRTKDPEGDAEAIFRGYVAQQTARLSGCFEPRP